ncbi:sigma-70 family RNA polymerase sigma factor [Promicromonospora thailandica]|uniref:RNA polymerase sigma factor, sigma-70 family n=1 Tax=Promicromonospora thailandica TaxID=765201 RepID=A0A9X2G4D2_9MICO|nr:sigma-70 family RNA polymerase sigma factor [Promicromonospora thailandica]MCP2266875.1 RNA polymerase sigma factor, sigma-70 family [Promicromonospora thailandica]
MPSGFSEGELQVFLAERTRLLWVAHRVVGDPAAAEDVVQDAWLRWQRTDKRQVASPPAWLTTATTHLAINVVRSARYRHERLTDLTRLGALDVGDGPADSAERAVVVDRLLAFLMARLTASELAACLLRRCFSYPYQEIAALLRTTVPNARQLVHRSRTDLAGSTVRRVDAAEHRRLAAAFTAAAVDGDLARLERVLAAGAGRLAHDSVRPSGQRWDRSQSV